MKNFVNNFLMIFVLTLNPIDFTRSSNIENIFKENLTLLNKEDLINEIDIEYIKFYSELFIYDSNISKRSNINNIDFIIDIHEYALKSKSLASISIAQAILETGYGRHSKLENNIFGIKGKGIKSKTKEYYNGKFISIRDEFQYFSSLEQAFKRHDEILSRYEYENRDYKHWAYQIKKSGYATDPYYAEKLIYIIEKHNLSRLDKIQVMKKSLIWKNRNQYVGIS